MYFDFGDYRPDVTPVGSAISAREGVLLSIVFHTIAVLFLLFGPRLPAADREALLARQTARQQQQLQREREARRFVFVAPKRDVEALEPPLSADDSDKNRMARSRERALSPTNSLPFARGNTKEKVEVEGNRPRGAPGEPQVMTRDAGGGDRELNRDAVPLPSDPAAARIVPPQATARGATGIPNGALREALRNLEKYVRAESFDNQQGGGGAFGPAIQFDTKGVEFGPWIRRFVAQIKRNWFIPYAAMSMKGHVVVTFYVHKDGTISALAVPGPSKIEAFDNAAYNALASSNPTQPLPPEYPSERARFTVTFYYNEAPPP